MQTVQASTKYTV